MPLATEQQSQWVDEDGYASLVQADTLVYPAVHFWDMHEAGSPAVLTDVVAGATIGDITLVTGGNSPNAYINALSDPGGSAITNGVAIGDKDFLILSVARSVGGSPSDNNGHTGFYWQSGSYTFKSHPYYGLIGQTYRSLSYQKNWVRTIGEIYTHAIVRRDNYLEYYCLPRGWIDTFNILESNATSHAGSLIAPTLTFMGHGGYGTPYNNGVGRLSDPATWSDSGDVGQDYAGVAVYAFNHRAPTRDDIVRGMRWCEDEWTTKASGKRLYPGWIID